MTCADFQRWLDEGRPDAERSRMTGHSAQCIRCERELVAANEMERVLAVAVPVAVSAGFNDLVLQRIHSSRSGWRRALDVFGQIMAEPLVPLCAALTVMIGWSHEALMRAIDRLPVFSELTFVSALVVAAFVLCVSWQIFRTVQRVA
jgi:hypothetical protein